MHVASFRVSQTKHISQKSTGKHIRFLEITIKTYSKHIVIKYIVDKFDRDIGSYYIKQKITSGLEINELWFCRILIKTQNVQAVNK